MVHNLVLLSFIKEENLFTDASQIATLYVLPTWVSSLSTLPARDAVKVLHSVCQQIWKTQQWPQDWERSGFFPIPKKGNAKECSNYCTIALIWHAGKLMLKILQARLNSMWNVKFQMFKLDLEKAVKPTKLPTSLGSSKSQRVPEKNLLLLYWLCQSLWLCGSQQIENS